MRMTVGELCRLIRAGVAIEVMLTGAKAAHDSSGVECGSTLGPQGSNGSRNGSSFPPQCVEIVLCRECSDGEAARHNCEGRG